MTDIDLQPADLEQYTLGRLSASDPRTQTILSAALQAVRSYCKWYVCPVVTDDVITLDGPGHWGGYGVGMGSLYGGSYYNGTGTLVPRRVGSGTLFLPTKNLLSITSIVEDGNPLDLSTVQWSRSGVVVKQAMLPWSTNLSSITVTYTHGWSVAQAQDWRSLALAIADRMSMVRGLIGPFPTNIGPYRLGGFYGESRGSLPNSATWLDDLLALIDMKRYVIEEI